MADEKFNPDAYLQQAGGFDPDAYLSGGEKPQLTQAYGVRMGGREMPIGQQQEIAKTIGGLGVEGGIATLGQGAGFAAAGPMGASVVGGPASILGYLAGSAVRGERPTVSGATQAFIMGLIPGEPLANAAAKTVVKEISKQAAGGVAGEIASATIDKRDVSPENLALAGIGATAGTLLGKSLDGGKIATRQESKKISEAITDANVARFKTAGGKTLPSMVSTSKLNDLFEAIGGKKHTIAEIRDLNEELFTTLSQKSIGLDPRIGPLTEKRLKDAVVEAAKPYAEIRALQEKAEADLKALQTANRLVAQNEHELQIYESNKHFVKQQAELTKEAAMLVDKFRVSNELANKYAGSPLASEQLLAQKYRDEAKGYLGDIEKGLKDIGRKDLWTAFNRARVQIAKIGEIEKALTPSGRVSPDKLAESIKGGTKFTGDLRMLAMMSAEPKLRPVATSNVAPVDNQGLVQEVADLFRKPVRSVIASEPYQNSFLAQPSYAAMPDFLSRFIRTETQAELRHIQNQPNSLLQFYSGVYPRKQ